MFGTFSEREINYVLENRSILFHFPTSKIKLDNIMVSLNTCKNTLLKTRIKGQRLNKNATSWLVWMEQRLQTVIAVKSGIARAKVHLYIKEKVGTLVLFST